MCNSIVVFSLLTSLNMVVCCTQHSKRCCAAFVLKRLWSVFANSHLFALSWDENAGNGGSKRLLKQDVVFVARVESMSLTGGGWRALGSVHSVAENFYACAFKSR